jgi:hypothetical protein
MTQSQEAKVNQLNNIIMEKLFVNNKKLTKEEQSRVVFLWGFIGTNRTGKSVIARKSAEIWRRSRPDGMIVGFDPQKRFVGLLDDEIDPEDPDWCLKLHSLRDSLVILDDYRLINEKPTAVVGLQKLMYHRADWGIDIIYICHNPSLILNLLTYFTSHYFLFYTESMDGSFQKKIMNYKLCISGQKLINKHVKTYGRGSYPNFPYVMVDCERRELNAFNFNNK